MRIIYHHRTLGDGAEGIHIREMIQAFRSLGHEVHVFAPVGENAPESLSSNQRRGGLSRIKNFLPGFAFEFCEIGYSFFSFFVLTWKCLRLKPDFIYDRYITFNVGCVLAAKLTKIPIFLEVNAPLALERSEQPDEKLYLKFIAFSMEKWICSRVTKTIVVSTPLKDYLVSKRVPASQIIVMPNGVNPDKFFPHKKKLALLQYLRIDPNATFIGFTGVLRAWHGLDLLVSVFNEGANLCENVQLLIVGDGPIKEELERMVRAFHIEHIVHITGRVPYESVHEYVNLFDIAVSPKSTFYASPMKIVEYMALGKAIVAPNGSNFRDILDDGINGILFDSDAMDSFYQAVYKLIADPEKRNFLSNAAYQKVNASLNWKNNATSVCSLVENVL